MKTLLSGLRRRQKLRRNSDGPVWVMFLVGPQQPCDDSLSPSPGAVCPGKLQRRSAGDFALHAEKTALAGAVQRLGFFFLPVPLPCLNCFSLPSGLQRLFERRNWTPQAMLYLKGARKSQTLHSLHRSDGGHPGIPNATEQEPGERVLHLAPEK